VPPRRQDGRVTAPQDLIAVFDARVERNEGSGMSSVFEKLNLKNQRDIVVVNAPARFEPELRALAAIAVRRRIPASGPIEFALVFATEQGEVDAATAQLAKVAQGDAIVWFAYPKGTSKRYTCSLNRDTGWKALGRAGFEPVRQIAIDEDWSGLRFRRTEFIRSMTRAPERAMSRRGRTKAAQGTTGRRQGDES
jgi:hypothetical protein